MLLLYFSYDLEEDDQYLEDVELREKKPEVYYKKLINKERNDLPIKKPILNTNKGFFKTVLEI